MRILALADLHSTPRNEKALRQAAEESKKDDIDVVVIAGDVSDWGIGYAFESLHNLFDVPVVFCLGNHEFARRTVADVMKRCNQQQGLYFGKGIYCLDVVRTVTIKGVTFGGNVLWYDGTLSNMDEESRRKAVEHINPHWLDASIKDFDVLSENRLCVERIMHLKEADGPKVLVTHTVPHKELNWFETNMPDSPFNIYSGVADLISKVQPDVAICGHTHKRVIARIGDCRCFNIGNDYSYRDGWVLQKDIIEL